MKRVTPIDWDDPEIRKIGELYRRAAYILVNELAHCGADPNRLLHPRLYRDLPDDGLVRIPAQIADILMVTLLSLPRSKRGPRAKTPTKIAQQLVAEGMPKRKAARLVAEEMGEDVENIRRRLRVRKPRK